MSVPVCSNCGAAMDQAQRFCRKCGSPSNLEAETRELEQPRPFPLMTEPVGQAQTSPTVFTPGAMFGVPVEAPLVTQPPKSSRTPILLVGALFGIVLMILVALGGFLFLKNFGGSSSGPMVVSPPPAASIPEVPAPPPAPPGIPEPPAPPSVTEGDSPLRYPGAQVLMITSGRRERVITMRTQASIDTVIRWYESRLSVTKKVSLPGSAILKSSGATVIIKSDGEATSILVTESSDQ